MCFSHQKVVQTNFQDFAARFPGGHHGNTWLRVPEVAVITEAVAFIGQKLRWKVCGDVA